jgi:ComF family protein
MPPSQAPPAGRTRLRDRAGALALAAVDFFLPPVCPSCNRRLRIEEYGLCADCHALLEAPAEPLCPYCGSPRAKTDAAGRCKLCKKLPRDGFDAARAAYLYHGPLVDTLHHLKYHRHEELSECLGRWLFLYWRKSWPETAEVDVILPIPLHTWRLWKRGYNQSESLARVLGRLGQTPVAVDSLLRTKPTPTQTRLRHEDRWENVCDAFAVEYAPAVADKRILLVDDVMTTGATLCAAAQTLKRHHARSVHALALARAM